MARGKKEMSLTALKKKVLPLIDTRATDNNGILVQRDRKITMADIFGSEQKAAVAYFVSDLIGKGFNNQQISEAVELKYDLKWGLRQVNIVKELLKRIWRAEIAYTMNEQIAKELASIDLQQKELWAAWEFSKKGITHTKNRKENSSSNADEMNYSLTETVTEEDTTAGDPRYMQQIISLGSERRKLLGLYAPEKKDNTNAGNTAIQLNIVGDGASQDAASVMRAILNQGQPKIDVPVQEAEVIEANKPSEDSEAKEDMIDIDSFMRELMEE